MSLTGCAPSARSLTDLLRDERVKEAFRAAIASGATADRQVYSVLAFADEATVAVVQRELGGLPEHAIATICQAWAAADRFGKAFELISVPPSSALEFARERRVRIVVDTEEDSVRVSLSHVPGRHASWIPVRAPVLAGY